MKTMLVVMGIVATPIGTATVSTAQTAMASDQSAFGFQVEQTKNHRGVAVEGYVHNALPWRITNVRLPVDSIDADGTLMASASGWVLGDVAVGGRGYCYVPVSTPAARYRATIQRFDKVMLEPQALQSP